MRIRKTISTILYWLFIGSIAALSSWILLQ